MHRVYLIIGVLLLYSSEVAMAEDRFNSNTKSPRFSTTKALGFRGGSTNAQTGNLQQPTFLQSAGINPAAPKPPTSDAAGGPGIAQFNAGNVPKPSLAGTLATQAGGVLAGEALKSGARGIAGTVKAGLDRGATQPWSNAGPAFGLGTGAIESGVAPSGAVIGGPIPDAWQGMTATELAPLDVGAAAGEAAGAAAPAFAGGPAYAAASAIVQNDLIPKAVEGAGNIADKIAGLLGCFITEAVMSSGGADNGIELEALRGFRDNILSATPQGQAMIGEYDAIAPIVVEAVSARQDGVRIFQQIKSEFIDPAVEAVQNGDYQAALQIYAQMISFVTPFAAEAAEAGMSGMDSGEMNRMGDHAAMIGHSPELASAAMPDGGGEWDPGVDDDAMMAGGGMMPMGQPSAPPQQMAGPSGLPQPAAADPMLNVPGQVPANPSPGVGSVFARRY